MGDFKITFGDAAANRTISDDELKTVSQKTSLDEEKQQSIFTKAFDKNADGVIDETELSKGLEILKKSASADGHTDNLSDDEARAFLAQHNIEDARVEDLYGFFNKAKEVYAEHAAQDEKKTGEGAEEQPTVQAEEQEEEPAEEHAEEAPVDKGKVYAKNGETFDQTAKRLGFEKGTEEYNEFVKANPQAAKKHWFRLGVEINIPKSLKDKVKDEAYGVDRKAEEAKYKEAVRTKTERNAAADASESLGAANGKETEKAENAGSTSSVENPPAAKKSVDKKNVSNANLKESNLKGVFYDPKTKTHYTEQDGKMVEWRPSKQMADNEKVVQVNSDGSFVGEWKKDGKIHHSIYNKKGQETKRLYGKSSKKFEADGTYVIYDLAHSGMEKLRKFSDGSIIVYKNNDDGNCTGTCYNADGSVHRNFNKDASGRETYVKFPSGETWTYEYNDDGSAVRMVKCADGTVIENHIDAGGSVTSSTVRYRGVAHQKRDRKDGLIESRQKGVYYDPQTKYHYINEDGEWVDWKPSSEMDKGEKVVRVHSDGSFVTEWKCNFGEINRSYYNSKGKWTKTVLGDSPEKFVRAKVQL